ncbi:MAG TPA: GYD domain-containing protein, partial [Chromatiales bacterium]|nr:GYD domain-containing protein [Chromatiales bacterium]
MISASSPAWNSVVPWGPARPIFGSFLSVFTLLHPALGKILHDAWQYAFSPRGGQRIEAAFPAHKSAAPLPCRATAEGTPTTAQASAAVGKMAAEKSRLSSTHPSPNKGEPAMATYVMFGKYSPEALKAVSARRSDEATELIRKFGGELKAVYALLGDVDLVVILELP